MWRLVLRRLAMMPLLLLGVVTIAFLLSHLTQANPLSAILSARQLDNPEVVAAAKARWGLDKPPLAQYGLYVAHVLQGDLGVSFRSNRPVLRDIADRLPATLELVIAAMIIGTVGGIGLGVIAVATRDRLWNSFWDALSHLVLPSVALAWSTTGIVSRLVRGSMLEVLGQDYILMARAKGASETRVLVNHALRNALLPTLTVTGFTFAYLITGAVLVETIFAWPGIGSYAVDSVRVLDYPGIMGVTIVGGTGFLLATLVTDISYIFADPKLRQHS